MKPDKQRHASMFIVSILPQLQLMEWWVALCGRAIPDAGRSADWTCQVTRSAFYAERPRMTFLKSHVTSLLHCGPSHQLRLHSGIVAMCDFHASLWTSHTSTTLDGVMLRAA